MLDALNALDVLNSWVRSPSYAPAWGGPRDAIYHLKGEALKRASAEGLSTHRLVRVEVKCRDCGGTGRYHGHWGYRHDHCRACRSTGTTQLRFVETTIAAAAIRWHTPRNRFPLFDVPGVTDWPVGVVDLRDPEPAPPPLADGWTVNEPGKDLEPAAVARCLNLAEKTFPHRPPPCWRYEGAWHHPADDGYRYDLFAYRLHVGLAVGCGVCGAAAAEPSYRCRIGRIEWSALACPACTATYSDRNHRESTLNSRLEWDGPPWALVSDPAIIEWITRHPMPHGVSR